MNITEGRRFIGFATEFYIILQCKTLHYHPVVARSRLEHKVNLVTASYVSPDIQALHQRYVVYGRGAGIDLTQVDHICVARRAARGSRERSTV